MPNNEEKQGCCGAQMEKECCGTQTEKASASNCGCSTQSTKPSVTGSCC